VFLACFYDYRKFLAPGERGTVLVVATDRRQARVIFRYVEALITHVPLLATMVTSQRADGIDLTNGLSIEIHTASFRSTRGYTIVAALLDEIAFWLGEESSDPDSEIISAIRPAMATIPNAMLLCASSPYARHGALWETYRKHYGKDGSVFVWQAATRVMNPTVPERLIKEHLADDPARAAAEWLAEFRSDVESFINRDAVEACVTRSVLERPPREGVRYTAFTDPSGGSSDSFTLAVAHRENENIILDCVREVRPPFSPESVVSEFATLLKQYRVLKVAGDRYAGEWPRSAFKDDGITYDVSLRVKSDLYRDLLPLLNSRRVELLDSPRLVAQIASLERRTARSGKDSIDHPPHSHDDLANAAAGALLTAHNTNRGGIRMAIAAPPYAGGRGYEIDPITLRPLDAPARTRVRWVNVSESEAPAVK